MPAGGRRKGAGRKPGSKQIAPQVEREAFAASLKALLPEATTILAEIMRSVDAGGAARLKAIDTIFDRALGKPPQAIQHQGHEGGPVQVNLTQTDAALCYGPGGRKSEPEPA